MPQRIVENDFAPSQHPEGAAGKRAADRRVLKHSVCGGEAKLRVGRGGRRQCGFRRHYWLNRTANRTKTLVIDGIFADGCIRMRLSLGSYVSSIGTGTLRRGRMRELYRPLLAAILAGLMAGPSNAALGQSPAQASTVTATLAEAPVQSDKTNSPPVTAPEAAIAQTPASPEQPDRKSV